MRLTKLINNYTVKVSICYILSINALWKEGQAGSSTNLLAVAGRLGILEDAIFFFFFF